MEKHILQVEFRYHDIDKTGRLCYPSRIITIGVYDTIDEAIAEGNKAIETLSAHFDFRNDRLQKN